MPTAVFQSDFQRIGNEFEEHWKISVTPNELASLDITPKYIQKTRKVDFPGDYTILSSDKKTVRIHNYPLIAVPTIDTTGVPVVAHRDLSVNSASAYNGTQISTFKVIITTAAATDKFDWYQDGVLKAAAVSITGGFQALANGIQIKFGAITGHSVNDTFLITAEPNPGVFDLIIRGYGG
jgi:hypothetical protein